MYKKKTKKKKKHIHKIHGNNNEEGEKRYLHALLQYSAQINCVQNDICNKIIA